MSSSSSSSFGSEKSFSSVSESSASSSASESSSSHDSGLSSSGSSADSAGSGSPADSSSDSSGASSGSGGTTPDVSQGEPSGSASSDSGSSSSGPPVYAWEIQGIDVSGVWYGTFDIANTGEVDVVISDISSEFNDVSPTFGVIVPGDYLEVTVTFSAGNVEGANVVGDEITVVSDGGTVQFLLE